MSPALYDVSQSSSLLSAASSSSSQAASSSTSRRSTLTVVIGFIGVLLVVSFTSGICIYIFRGRLFISDTVPDPKEAQTTEDGTRPTDHASIVDSDNGIHRQSESKAPTLRPLLLGTPSTALTKDPYKPLLLPQMQHGCQLQSYQGVSRSRTDATKRRHQSLFTSPTGRQSFPFGNRLLTPPPRKHIRSTQPVLKVSRSCPVGLHQDMVTLPDAAGLQIERRDIYTPIETLTPAARFPYFFLASEPDESMDSSYSEGSDESSPSGHLGDYCYNGRMYESTLSSQPESEGEVGSDSVYSSHRVPPGNYKERRASLIDGISAAGPVETSCITTKTCARAASTNLSLSKRSSHAIMRRKYSSFAIRPSAAKLRKVAVKSKFSIRPNSAKMSTIRSHKQSQENLVEDKDTVGSLRMKQNPEFNGASLLRNTKQSAGPNEIIPSEDLAPRIRQPFGAITNAIATLNGKACPPVRPMLLLNDVPADELEHTDGTTRPPSLHSTNPPPSDPELLSVRWVPKPVARPLALTVLVKGNSAHPASYLSHTYRTSSSSKAGENGDLDLGLHTISVSTYAENTIADLRAAVEDMLGYRVYLRGMVHVGKRKVFLPLLTERFFREWVEERVNEGRKGVVEAWRRDYY